MKVLVTGATGFVGSFLCSLLESEGHSVVPVSRKTGKNLFNLNQWKSELKGCDAVVHLAARVHQMKDSSVDPIAEYRLMNRDITEQLAKACVEFGVNKFIFLSSIKVNGEGGKHPYSENDVPHPSDPYGVSKYEAEIALKVASDNSELKVCCIRSPLIYGRGVKANFKSMINIAKKRAPLPIKSIENKRSFLYVENLCDFILKGLYRDWKSFDIYLLADGGPVSTFMLFEKLSLALGVKHRCFPFPAPLLKLCSMMLGKKKTFERIGESLFIDTSNAMNIWTPPFSMEEGLKRTVKNE